MGSILLGSRAEWGVGGPDALVVLGLDEGERVVGQLVTDLFAPGPVPALDDALGLAILHARVEEPDAELRADEHERLGDVGGAEVDVVAAGRSRLGGGLLGAV